MSTLIKNKFTGRAINRKFTLIEMLVVVAIISILAALLMPSLNKSLNAGRTIICSNNLRQRHISFTSYINDFYSWYPNDRWQTTFRELGYEPLAVQRQIIVCPSAPQTTNLGYDLRAHYQYTGVYYNETHIFFTNYVTKYHTRINEVVIPSSKIVLSENWVDNTDADEYTMPLLNNLKTRIVHMDGANFLFADGHIAWVWVGYEGQFAQVANIPSNIMYRPRVRP